MACNHKLTRGKQKINLKIIEKEDDRLVAFSKRRSGTYKKASELVTLCGAEVGLLVYSPSGKPFSFGHPSLEALVKRYLRLNPPPNDANTHPSIEALQKVEIDQLNKQQNVLKTIMEAEKQEEKMLKDMIARKELQSWLETPIDELNLKQLNEKYEILAKIRVGLCDKIEKKQKKDGASSSMPRPEIPATHVNNAHVSNSNVSKDLSEISSLLTLRLGHSEGKEV